MIRINKTARGIGENRQNTQKWLNSAKLASDDKWLKKSRKWGEWSNSQNNPKE